MVKSIEYLVKENLEDNGFNLNYDPEKSHYRPWFKIPFKVNFSERGIAGSGNMITRKINIPVNSKAYKTIDDIAGGLLHETGHIDIFPVELPLLMYGTNQIFNQFDNSVTGTIVTIGALAGYLFAARELVVESYNCIKHGTKKYLQLRWGKNER